MSKNDMIDNLLEKWASDKEKLAKLEKRIEKYKKIASELMDEEDTDILSGSDYFLKKRKQTRSTITKNDVPSEIWNQYSRKFSFYAYYLSERSKNRDK